MSHIKGVDSLRSDMLRRGKIKADGTWLHLWPGRRHTKWLCQSKEINNKAAPSPYDQLSGFHFGSVVVMVPLVSDIVGWEEGGKGTWYWSTKTKLVSPMLKKKKCSFTGLLRKERHTKANSPCAKRRIHVRRWHKVVCKTCDQEMVRLWCPWLQPPSKFVDYAAIVRPIVGPSRATQSQLLAAINRESHLQKATRNCVYWISEAGHR